MFGWGPLERVVQGERGLKPSVAAGAGTHARSAAPLERRARKRTKGLRRPAVDRKRMAQRMAGLNKPVREHPSRSWAPKLRATGEQCDEG